MARKKTDTEKLERVLKDTKILQKLIQETPLDQSPEEFLKDTLIDTEVTALSILSTIFDRDEERVIAAVKEYFSC